MANEFYQGGVIADPGSSLINGLLRGADLKMRMAQAQREDEAFKTQQALENQKMSWQDIMNRQMLGEAARPVDEAGTVTETRPSATSDQASAVPGMPSFQTTEPGGSFVRKADRSRLVKYGGQQYELKTPEEQEQSKLNRQIQTNSTLADAQTQAEIARSKAIRESVLKMENGGVMPNTPTLTRAEAIALQEAAQKIQDAHYKTLGAGGSMVEMPDANIPGINMPATAPATPTTPGAPPPAPSTPNTPGVGVSAPAPNAPAGPRVIATAPPAPPAGEFGAFLNAELMKKGYTYKTALEKAPDLISKATDDYANKKNGPENINQWIADSLSEDPATSSVAKKKLAMSIQQQMAGRPVINMTVPGLGPGTPSQANPTLTGEDFIKTLPPGTASQVRAIANGSMDMPPFGTRGASALLRDAVYRFDPTYTQQRAQIRKAFTTGKDGNNIGALNTATVHLDQMAEAAKAMKNGTFQPGNAVYNYIAAKFGSSAPTNYQFVMNALSGETASALKGAATDPEIAHVMATLTPNMSPEQAAGVANTGLHVFGAKLNTYKERYNQQIPGDTVYSPVLPMAKAVFDKYGINAGESSPGGAGNAGAATHKYNPATGKIEEIKQ